jgi:hypothetical protein
MLKGDNKGAIESANNPRHHNRTKHCLVRFQHVREQVSAGLVAIQYLATTEMPADGLTKPLSGDKHAKFIALLGLESPPSFAA